MRLIQASQLSQSPALKWRGDLWSHTAIDANTPCHNTNGMRPAIASINIANLQHNFTLLAQCSQGAEVMAVIKANAYGHGLNLIAPALFDTGCRHFAVTDATEGGEARKLIPEAKSIVLLSGIFDASDAVLAASAKLTPVITSTAQAELLRTAGFTGAVWIKVNTGMQRLGADDPATLIEQCESSGISIAGIMSHLACADTPEHPLNRVQAEEFRSTHQHLAPDLAASLLNSAGVVSLPDATFDFIRPGIALYGIEPVVEKPLGLKPVMQLTGEVMQVHQVAKGTSLSYGASFTAPEEMRIAVISLGYGDGLPRHLSNLGSAIYQGHRLSIVGRVCMDFCLVDVGTHEINRGDPIEFWGESLGAGEVAEQIGTIAYELFTDINKRVHRRAI